MKLRISKTQKKKKREREERGFLIHVERDVGAAYAHKKNGSSGFIYPIRSNPQNRMIYMLNTFPE